MQPSQDHVHRQVAILVMSNIWVLLHRCWKAYFKRYITWSSNCPPVGKRVSKMTGEW